VGPEFRSRHQLFGLPVLHVAWGTDPFTGRPRVARGIVAVGPVALGVIAVGPIAVGLIAVGLIATGLVAAAGQITAALLVVGQLALGGVLALGELATGRGARGGLTFTTCLPLAVAWLAAATAVGRVSWRRRDVRRILRGATRIALAEPGARVVRGRIVALKMVEAPVSRRTCVGYDVRRGRTGRPTEVERACEDFLIDDGSGRARVLAGDVQLILDSVKRVSLGIESRVVASEAAGAGSGTGVVRAVGTAVERVLLPGDEVIVSGHTICQLGALPQEVQVAFHAGADGPVVVTNRSARELRAEIGLGFWLAVPMALATLCLPWL
jgi:hypothetical protein